MTVDELISVLAEMDLEAEVLMGSYRVAGARAVQVHRYEDRSHSLMSEGGARAVLLVDDDPRRTKEATP